MFLKHFGSFYSPSVPMTTLYTKNTQDCVVFSFINQRKVKKADACVQFQQSY